MKPALRCLIVDDEAEARSYLRKRLQPHPELAVVGEAGSVGEAHALCRALRPEVVFLDVRMPLANGFELIPLLDPRPQIVFVTAFADRAVDAFQVNARDYLLKPYSAERMAETVDKLLGRGMRGQIAPPPAALKPQGHIFYDPASGKSLHQMLRRKHEFLFESVGCRGRRNHGA